MFGIAATPIAEAIGKPWLFIICGGFIVLDLIILNVIGLETLGKTSTEIDTLFVKEEPQQEKP